MKRWISGAIILFGLAGCGAIGQQKSVVERMDAAAVARAKGDWERARSLYARAFEDESLTQTSPRFRAVLHYEYGRALGVTCQFRKAEEELTAAHDLDKKSGGVFYISLAELARLNLAQKKHAEAAGYFERVLVELEPEIIARKAPDFYIAVLEDYAQALAGAGRQQEADAALQRAAAVRAEDWEAESWAGDERTPYGTRCK